MTKTNQETIAVVSLGGKQYLVSPGAKFTVNRLENQEGESLTTENLLASTKVQLKIVRHLLGDKIHGLKFKNKVRYIRHYGHRQHLTELEVISIGSDKPAAKAETTPVKEPKPKAETIKKTVAKPKAKKVVKTKANG